MKRLAIRGPGTTSPQLYQAALQGRTPAEALSKDDQERLVRELVRIGWTDTAIATHTQWTTYTVGRIRDRLGLVPNL